METNTQMRVRHLAERLALRDTHRAQMRAAKAQERDAARGAKIREREEARAAKAQERDAARIARQFERSLNRRCKPVKATRAQRVAAWREAHKALYRRFWAIIETQPYPGCYTRADLAKQLGCALATLTRAIREHQQDLSHSDYTGHKVTEI